jgi:flagellar FliL protein
MSDAPAEAAAPKKKGGMVKKIVLFGVLPLVLLGAGVGGGLYAAGKMGGDHAAPAEDPDMPKLVLKGEGGEAEHAAGEGGEGEVALPTAEPGGEKYESTYYAMEKDFTSNLKDSPHFIQVGLAVSTNYDSRVIGNVQKHALPIRSAILMTLGDSGETDVFSEAGKAKLQESLKRSINRTLKEKTGFGGIGNVYFTSFVVQ